jgi:protein ImuB
MARIACILVADFSIAALVRAKPECTDAVLAIASTLAPHGELAAVAPCARKLGIRAGMTIAQARAVSSDLIVALASPAAESSALAALADAAESVSPAVEPGPPGCVWVDLTGLNRLYADENGIAAEIMRRVRRMGMEPAIGVAADKSLAHIAARGGGVRIIDSGREREFLAWLPLDMLALGRTPRGDDLETMLARLGMRRLGDLVRLDPDEVGTRLGREGVELVRLARGESAAPLVPRRRAEVFTEAVELEYGIETLEPLAFIMRAMLERIAARLEVRGLAAGDLLLTLGLDGHRRFSRRVPMTAATNDARAMLTLVNLSLEGAPPEAAVETIRIEVAPRAKRPAQVDLFLPPAPAPDRLETTLARLAALCGPDNVGALGAENSHRPEAVRIAPFAPPTPKPVENGCAKNVTQLVIRAIRPTREIEVICSRGIPEFVRGENLGARVVSIAGPWRRDGEWWSGALGDPPAPMPHESTGDDKLWASIRRRGEYNDTPASYPGKQWSIAADGVPASPLAITSCYESAATPVALQNNLSPRERSRGAQVEMSEFNPRDARVRANPGEYRGTAPSPADLSGRQPLPEGEAVQKDGAVASAPTSSELRAIEAAPRHGGRMMWKHPRDVSAENLKSLAASIQTHHGQNSNSGINCPLKTESADNLSPRERSRGAQVEMSEFNLRDARVRANSDEYRGTPPSPADRSGRRPLPGGEAIQKLDKPRRGFIRDYYELALDDGGVYRVFRDITTEQWFVDGIYD